MRSMKKPWNIYFSIQTKLPGYFEVEYQIYFSIFLMPSVLTKASAILIVSSAACDEVSQTQPWMTLS